MSRPRKPHRKRVLVQWDDAETSDGWESVKTLQDSPTRSVISLGWIVQDKPTYIVLAADYGHVDDETNRRLTIPRAWINKITRI